MISAKKTILEKDKIIKECKSCGGIGCGICYSHCAYIDKLAEADIPVDYWFRKMDDFYGDQKFKEFVRLYNENILDNYMEGKSLRFVGHRGAGKTMGACAILKQAVIYDYTIHYTTLVEAVTKLMSPESYYFRKKIKQCDFMVIDEVDQRFFPSPGSQELYGNHYENIIRTRLQNKLPTIMCSNEEDVDKIFAGEFRISSKSLDAQFVKTITVFGKDAREGKEKLK